MRLKLAVLGIMVALAALPTTSISQPAAIPTSMMMAFVCHRVDTPVPVNVTGYFYLVVAQASVKTGVACRPASPAAMTRMGMADPPRMQDWVRSNLLGHQFQSY
ncbi:MAG TPA: hypothetical protein VMD91_10330 [Candidatus Sulfotelmatobacter sp.]|nr:hypothetical protein [Candidatus Sulfotelmatobacter sp.]